MAPCSRRRHSTAITTVTNASQCWSAAAAAAVVVVPPPELVPLCMASGCSPERKRRQITYKGGIYIIYGVAVGTSNMF